MTQVPVAVALFYGGPIAMHVFQQDAAVSGVSWRVHLCLTHSALRPCACGPRRHCMLDALASLLFASRTPKSAAVCAAGADIHAWDAARPVAIHLELCHHEGRPDRAPPGGTSTVHQIKWSRQKLHKPTCAAPGAEVRIGGIRTAAAAPRDISIASITIVIVNLACQNYELEASACGPCRLEALMSTPVAMMSGTACGQPAFTDTG